VFAPLEGIHPAAGLGFDETILCEVSKHYETYLAETVGRIQALGLSAQCALLEGGVAETIRRHALDVAAELIVMSTHGYGPLARFWLGSVADRLIHKAPAPVLLMRPGDIPRHVGAEIDFHHVLLPLDGSTLAEQMIEPALALAEALGLDVTLFRAVQPILVQGANVHDTSAAKLPLAVIEHVSKAEARLLREAQDYLELVAQRWRARKVAISIRVALAADPTSAILAEAEAADVIALATHGRRGLARVFRGSVADKLVRAATGAVLVQCPAHAQDSYPLERPRLSNHGY
jgi:nucleotide-binding universal stress UspA family protein